MGELLNIVTPLHQNTRRDYISRMLDEKVECMRVAKQYDEDFWDGDRRYGYGGYKYIPGWWQPVAERLIEKYCLGPGSKVLDAGCGKAYLLYDLTVLQPELEVAGFDISSYGLQNAKEEVKSSLFKHDLRQPFPFENDQFDLVISLNSLHNLPLRAVSQSLCEIERVGKKSYVLVESFRNEEEFFNAECWALTAETLVDVDSWKWLHEQSGFTGDYEFIFFE